MDDMDQRRYELFKRLHEFIGEKNLKRCGAYADGWRGKAHRVDDETPQGEENPAG